MTLGMLRLRFWIPQGRAVVKRWRHQCVTCTRWRAATPQPKMGNLPPRRVTPARAFLHVGIDYAGPIFIRTSKGRGHSAHKAFIAVLFVLVPRPFTSRSLFQHTPPTLFWLLSVASHLAEDFARTSIPIAAPIFRAPTGNFERCSEPPRQKDERSHTSLHQRGSIGILTPLRHHILVDSGRRP